MIHTSVPCPRLREQVLELSIAATTGGGADSTGNTSGGNGTSGADSGTASNTGDGDGSGAGGADSGSISEGDGGGGGVTGGGAAAAAGVCTELVNVIWDAGSRETFIEIREDNPLSFETT